VTPFIFYFIAGLISSIILMAWNIVAERSFRIEHLGALVLGVMGGYVTLLILILLVMDVHGRKTLFDWRKK
jgi:hypothetical protein